MNESRNDDNADRELDDVAIVVSLSYPSWLKADEGRPGLMAGLRGIPIPPAAAEWLNRFATNSSGHDTRLRLYENTTDQLVHVSIQTYGYDNTEEYGEIACISLDNSDVRRLHRALGAILHLRGEL